MSETINTKQVPNNTINYIVFGKENEIELTATGKEQAAVHTMPGIPMEIKVEGYEIILDEKSGKVLRVKDNRTINEVIDDRRRRKIMAAMKEQKEEGIEHE